MKWSNRLGVFRFATLRSSTVSLDSAARCCYCVYPSIFQRTSRNFAPALPEGTRIFRVSPPSFSISTAFDISYERLLINYMLKQYS